MKQKTGRKLLSVLLALAMVLGLMPGMGLTAYAETVAYDLWVGGTQVTSDNCTDIPADSAFTKSGKASYDPETKTLILDNYCCTGNWSFDNTSGMSVVYFKGSRNLSKIKIKGNVSLSQNDAKSAFITIYDADYFPSTITIEGEGDNPTLSVKSGSTTWASSQGIQISNLTIKNCTVEAEAGDASSMVSRGIKADKSLTIINSTVTAIGKNSDSANDYPSEGIKSGIINIDNKSTVTAKGKTNAISGTIKHASIGQGYNNIGMTGTATEIAANTEGTTYSYKAIKLVPPPHTHAFTYSTNDATITATCTADGCTLTDSKATLIITPPAKTVYGDANSAKATLTGLEAFYTATGKTVTETDIAYYAATKSGTTYTKSGNALASAPTNAGDYVAEITVNTGENNVTASAGYTIAKAQADSLSEEQAREGVTINYANETVTAQNTFEVSLDGENKADSPADLGDIFNSTGTPTIYVRRAATDNKSVGEWVAVTLTSRPEAPSNLGSTNATNAESADGVITGVSSTMEYSANGTNWIGVEFDSIKGLNPGTYSVRFKATGAAPHGAVAEVTVGSNYKALDDTTPVTIKKGDSELTDAPVVGNELTATCDANDITYQWYRGNEAIEGANSSTYSVTAADAGKTIKVVATQTKDSNGQEITGTKPTKDSAATSAVVKKTPETLSTDDAKTKAGINYQTEQAAPDSGYEVSTDGTNKTESPISLTGIIDSESPKIYVRTAENDDTAAGAWVEVTIVARPDEPTGLTTESANTATSQDGKIKGTTGDMEYKLKGSTNGWTAAMADETLVASGTYLIRTKALSDKPAGKTAEVAVGSKEIILTDAQKSTAKTNLVFTGSKQALVNEPAENLPEGAKEIQYALGTKDAATQPYSTSIPTATNAGTYYVWYKVVGDANHNDVAPEKVSVNIGKADATITAKDQTIKEGESVAEGTGNVEVSGLLTGHSLDTISLESGTGETAGKVIASDARIKDGNNQDVTSNYTVVYTPGTLTVRAALSRTVTFKVVNGSWNDETATDKTVTLTGYEGDTLKLTADQIPTVGTKPNDTYKAGSWDVMPNTDTAITEATTYTYTYVAKEASVVTKAPEAKTLTYNGQAQELVTAGTATGGEMQYALGNATEATQPYTTSIPTATDAGIYYVWYKAVGDADHVDSGAAHLEVEIGKASITPTVSIDSWEYGETAKTPSVEGNTGNGDVTYTYAVKGSTEFSATVPTAAGEYTVKASIAATDNYGAAETTADYIIKKTHQSKPTGLKAVNVNGTGAKDGQITGVSDGMEYSVDGGKTWTKVAEGAVRIDNLSAGNVLVRYAETGNKTAGEAASITIGVTQAPNTTEKEVVEEKEAEQTVEAKAEIALNAGLKISQTGSKIKIKWGRVADADGYKVYVQYCGSKFGKAVKTIKKNSKTSVKITRLNGKKIKLKKNFKVYVTAYKTVDGKKVRLAKTIEGHVVGRKNTKFTNAKSIELKTKSVSVAAGKTAEIKAETVLVNSKKKQLSDAHAKEFRYASSDKTIATVDANGKIKGISKGTCTIYVYARNGYAKKVSVTVK